MTPEGYARGVAAAMLALRGWGSGEAPRDVVADVFATMALHDARYVAGYAAGDEPAEVARRIQWAEWSRPRG